MNLVDVERVGLWVKPEPVLKMGMGMGQKKLERVKAMG
jgi:hypothetical protein